MGNLVLRQVLANGVLQSVLQSVLEIQDILLSRFATVQEHIHIKQFFSVFWVLASQQHISTQIVTIRLSYKLKWKESRMLVNESAGWSKGEINISPENIQVRLVLIILINFLDNNSSILLFQIQKLIICITFSSCGYPML